MKDYALLSILHISDFHYSKRQLREQEIVVDALINDLVNLCIGHRRPDLILFTGDLVQAGGTDSHEEAYDALLDRVAAASESSSYLETTICRSPLSTRLALNISSGETPQTICNH